jgi:hypothetical protein
MAIESREIEVDNRILKLFGECVAVCWRFRTVKKTLIQDGIEFTANIHEKENDPFIDFVAINRDVDSGLWYKDDDSPVSGGLSVEFAEQIAAELAAAIAYIRELEKKA